MSWTWLHDLLPLAQDLWPWLLVLVGMLNLGLVVSTTIHIVLEKRDSRAAIGWAGLVWFAPLIGALAYLCFGVNRIQRRAISLKLQGAWGNRKVLEPLPADLERRSQLGRRYPNMVGLATLGRNLTGQAACPGNKIEPLVDGDQAYPAMIEAINQAKSSVSLASYIFDCDRAGNQFLEALKDARDRGIEIRALIDDVGSRYSRPSMIECLQSAGIEARSFLPTLVPRLFKYSNLRNHRKLLVVDGRIGFTGGTNINEGHWLSLDPPVPIQCVHFRLTGPVVEHLQETFAVDWAFSSGESLEGEVWFPEIKYAGTVWARGIPDGPDEDLDKLTYTLIGALSAATETVRIVTPYFLPETVLIHALNVTALRGVDLRIYVPERNNVPLVHWASMAQYSQLLEKGCRIFLTAPPFDHTKLIVVDGIWSLIGSTNWDPRSLRLNFEFNVECYDDELAGKLSDLIDRKEQQATEVSLEDVHGRSSAVKLRDGLARLMTPYL